MIGGWECGCECGLGSRVCFRLFEMDVEGGGSGPFLSLSRFEWVVSLFCWVGVDLLGFCEVEFEAEVLKSLFIAEPVARARYIRLAS